MDPEYISEKLEEVGELHLVVEEHSSIAGDEYIGVRKGNTEFRDDSIVVDDGQTEHHIDSGRVVYFNIPNEFPD